MSGDMGTASDFLDFEISRPRAADRASDHAFLAIAALLFVASTALTIVWCRSMWGMGSMPMPGGWTMGMTWMRMPDQTWAAAAASFVCMWTVMMVAMMLPSVLPMLRRYREVVGSAGATRLGLLTLVVGSGYFSVWTVVGVVVYPLGMWLAALAMHHPALSRAVPMATAVVVLVACTIQFSAWKARQLACCRGRGHMLPATAGTAWRHGVRLGLDCARCCGNLMAILLVLGVMDLRVMAVIGTVVIGERLRQGILRHR